MRTTSACIVLCVAAATGVARADDEQAAAQHFKNGTHLFQDLKDYARAAGEFEAANRAKPAAASLLGAGLSWQKAGDLLRAAADLQAALTVGLDAPGEARARDALTEIDGSVGHLEIVGPTGARARVDDGAEAPVPLHSRVLAGDHTVEGRFAGGGVEHRSVTVAGGATLRIELVAPQPQKEPSPTPKAQRAPVLRTIGWIGAILGVATVGAGFVTIAIGNDANNRWNESGHLDTPLADEAIALKTASIALWIAGGVIAATGIVFVLLPRAKAQVSVGSNGAHFSVRF